MRARYYDSSAGRFLTRGTASILFDNPRELNRYVYVANNPVNLVDPSGLFAVFSAGLQSQYSARETSKFAGALGLAARSLYISIVAALVLAPIYGPLVGDLLGLGAEELWRLLQETGSSTTSTADTLTEEQLRQAQEALAQAEVISLAQAQARAEERREDVDIVCRNPSVDPPEHPITLIIGFLPKNPGATYTLMGHIINASKRGFRSQYISLTRSLEVAIRWKRPLIPIYAINLREVEGRYIDFTVPGMIDQYLRGVTARRYANASAEITLLGWVPPTAIKYLIQ